MEEITLRYILTRAISLILIIVVALYAFGYVKNRGQQKEIVSELRSLSSESSFFGQFSEADAKRSLIQAVGLIAEANKLGLEPDKAIDRSLGIEEKYFAMDDDDVKPSVRQHIIKKTLRSNYENFRKLGYEADFHILESMRKGDLPPIRTGPRAGERAEVGTIIDPTLSPGLETVLANLEIRPADFERAKMTDIEIAAAKTLVIELGNANVIEDVAEKRILKELADRAAGEEKSEEENPDTK